QDYQVQKRIPPVEVVPDPIEERSTYYRPHNRPQPSKHNHRDRVQRHPHVEGVRRVDECNLPDRERPRQPCKETTYDESDRLIEGRVHSDRTRGLLLLSYRLHRDTELRPRHEVHRRDAEGSHYGHHVVNLERQVVGDRDGEAGRGTNRIPVSNIKQTASFILGVGIAKYAPPSLVVGRLIAIASRADPRPPA